jgi:MFS family permease
LRYRSIKRDLEFATSGSQWVLNAYALIFGGLLLLCGRLGDRIGRRRLFVGGLLVFGIGSVVAGVATQAWILLVGRIVQGLGAAAFVPSSLSLLTANFCRRQTTQPRARGVRRHGRAGVRCRNGRRRRDHRTLGLALDFPA